MNKSFIVKSSKLSQNKPKTGYCNRCPRSRLRLRVMLSTINEFNDRRSSLTYCVYYNSQTIHDI